MENLYIGRGNDSDSEKILGMLDDVFFRDDKDKRTFISILPKIYKEETRPAYNNFVIKDSSGNFRAAVGNFCMDMSVGGEELKSCCIGNVGVDRKYRSCGYMTKLMEMSVEDMSAKEIDFSFLGGMRHRYRHFGYECAGINYNFYLCDKTVHHAFGKEKSGLSVSPLMKDDKDAIEKIDSLYSKRPVHAKRDIEKYYDILSSWRAKPYILEENGIFVGYFVLNDEKTEVSECDVISPEYFKKLILAVFEFAECGDMNFSTGPFEKEKLDFFNENAEGFSIGGCESILVFNYEKVLRAYMKAKAEYAKLCDGEITVLVHGKKSDEKLKITVKNNIPDVSAYDGECHYELTNAQAERAFFSNYTADRSIFEPEIQQWFPLPFYFSSPDTM